MEVKPNENDLPALVTAESEPGDKNLPTHGGGSSGYQSNCLSASGGIAAARQRRKPLLLSNSSNCPSKYQDTGAGIEGDITSGRQLQSTLNRNASNQDKCTESPRPDSNNTNGDQLQKQDFTEDTLELHPTPDPIREMVKPEERQPMLPSDGWGSYLWSLVPPWPESLYPQRGVQPEASGGSSLDNSCIEKDSRAQLSKSGLDAELKLILHDSGRNVLGRREVFQQVMQTLNNFENNVNLSVEMKKYQAEEALQFLQRKRNERLPEDFPLHLGIAYRVTRKPSSYSSVAQKDFFITYARDVENLESQELAPVVLQFLSNGDFDVEVDDSEPSTACSILKTACLTSLQQTWRFDCETQYHPRDYTYALMMWISLALKFQAGEQLSENCLNTKLWKTYFVKEKETFCLKKNAILSIKRGLRFGEMIQMSAHVALSSRQVAELLTPETFVHPYSHLRETYLELKEFVHIVRDCDILSHIRKNHWQWMMDPCKKKTYKQKVGNGLENIITEGLHFLDCVSSIWTTRKWPMDALEKECEEWLSLLIHLVEVAEHHAIEFLSMFFKPTTTSTVATNNQDHITMEVCKLIEENKNVGVNQLLELFNIEALTSRLMSPPFLAGYLQEAQVSPQLLLPDDHSWTAFLTLVVEHLPGSDHHKAVYNFIVNIQRRSYSRNPTRAKKFIIHLMRLDIKGLFEPPLDQTIQPLVNLIREHIKTNQLNVNLLKDMLKEIPPSFKGSSYHHAILEEILQVFIPDAQALEGHDSQVVQTQVMVVTQIRNMKVTRFVECSSLLEKCCWRFIAWCCKMIQVRGVPFWRYSYYAWMRTYTMAIHQLGRLYKSYCAAENLSGEKCLLPQIPTTVHHSCTEFLLWVRSVHSILAAIKDKFVERKMNFDEGDQFLQFQQEIDIIGTHLNAEMLVVHTKDLEEFKAGYISKCEELRSLLYPSSSCYSTLSLLELFNIKLPRDLQNQLNSLVQFPCEEESKPPNPNIQNLSLPIDDSEGRMRLYFKKEAHLQNLSDKLENVKRFLEPIVPKVKLWIKLVVTEIFRRYLHVLFQQTTAESDAEDAQVKRLGVALNKTVNLLQKLFNGSNITYREISADGAISVGQLNCDVDKEFDIIADALQVNMFEKAENLNGLKSMAALLMLKPILLRLCDVCTQYEMSGCLDDLKLKELNCIAEEVGSELTSHDAISKMDKVKVYLKHPSTTRHLILFERVADSGEFYNFVHRHFFDQEDDFEVLQMQAKVTFGQMIEMITHQLQQEDYEEQVVHHLEPAFRYILPFLDRKQDFHSLLEKIVELDPSTQFVELRTVSENMYLIQRWFRQAEGDATLENVSTDLECILHSGCYTFDLSILSEPQLILKFNIYLSSSKRALGSEALEVWNARNIVDFEQKLALLDTKQRREDQITLFLHWNEIAHLLLNANVKLRKLGSEEHEFEYPLWCHSHVSDAELKVSKAEASLKAWQEKVDELGQTYPWLIFLSIPKVLRVHQLFNEMRSLCISASLETVVGKITNELSFLFQNSAWTKKVLKEVTSRVVLQNLSHASPMETVGHFLEGLLKSKQILECVLPKRYIQIHKLGVLLHNAPAYTQNQLVRLVVQVIEGLPEPYDILHCHHTTTEEEIKIFMRRVEKHGHRQYVILEINHLPYQLQEVLLKLYMKAEQNQILSTVTFHIIQTASSVFPEVPEIRTEDHQEPGSLISFEEAKLKCQKAIGNYGPKITSYYDSAHIELVFGSPGSGKTHYISEALREVPKENTITVAMNEAFTALDTIRKLNTAKCLDYCVVFFNFTVVPPGDAVQTTERTRFNQLMDEIGWFFFRMVLLGYVEDKTTGESFHFPPGPGWKLYIEVPSIGDPKESLAKFIDYIPSLGLTAAVRYIDPEKIPYCIDDDARLVCKYLKAYKMERINALYISDNLPQELEISIDDKWTAEEFEEGVLLHLIQIHDFIDIRELLTKLLEAFQTRKLGSKVYLVSHEVRFSTDPSPSDEECWEILQEFMPTRRDKITQKLFIGYMSRRCIFLENLPAFNFNSGIGERALLRKHKRGPRGKRYTAMHKCTNTVLLGSTLMKAMLDEVSEICEQNDHNWSQKAHQQLIYDTSDQGGTIGLIMLRPHELPVSVREDFERIGIEIPKQEEMHSREVLGHFLSRALFSTTTTKNVDTLHILDESDYVLTLDFTLKMLNINERYLCKVPVVIQGETGVGKTALIEMLSRLWNYELTERWKQIKHDILEFMRRRLQKCPHCDQFEECLRAIEKLCEGKMIKIENLSVIASICRDGASLECIEHPLQESLSVKSQLDSQQLFCPVMCQHLLKLKGDPVLILLHFPQIGDETYDSNDMDELFSRVERDTFDIKAIEQLLYLLLNATLESTFHKLNVHSALEPSDIKSFFKPVITQALVLQNFSATHRSRLQPAFINVTVYLDEVNATSYMGIFKEIIVDRTLCGEPIPENIFIIAACNPHRGDSLAARESSVDITDRVLKESYYVRKLHLTLELLIWDYGALDEYQEREYIVEKMKMLDRQLRTRHERQYGQILAARDIMPWLADLIGKSQMEMRQYACDQLISYGYSEEEAKVRAKSCVSQRDIQRVFTFYEWLMRFYMNPELHPQGEEHHANYRAVLVALGLVYYMRLTSKCRIKYVNWLEENNVGRFLDIFSAELEWFIGKVDLPSGIARTTALKENVFATIICCVTQTPLIIEGVPGSSKTLSFNITVANLQGGESKCLTFRNTTCFPKLVPHFYQCSRRTTSREIQTVFKRAINYQERSPNTASRPRSVVFMDEAGLPETEHGSLKVLHYYLDNPNVSFVAITNDPLDAAKTNRAVSLYRPEASGEDLRILAKDCLCSKEENKQLVESLCASYTSLTRKPHFTAFFGLRDFIYFLIYLRRKYAARITPQAILSSLERNFNGATPEVFEEVCQEFLGHHKLEKRHCLDVFEESLGDQALSNGSEVQTSIQSEVRYKLLIDPSEDDSLLRLMFTFGILDKENTRMYVCSDLPGDTHMDISTIVKIRHSALEGHTIVMCQTDRIHESFYDLFNQRFRVIYFLRQNHYFANITIGAYSKRSRINPHFQPIVVLKLSEIPNTPSPFLNRFEKYYLSHEILLGKALDNLPPCIRTIVKTAKMEAQKFLKAIDGCRSLYGFSNETLDSLILMMLPLKEYPHKPFEPRGKSGSESSDLKVFLLHTLLQALRKNVGFHFNQDPDELELDMHSIFAKVEEDIQFKEIMSDTNEQRVLESIDEALQVLHDAPEVANGERRVEAFADSLLVISVLQQWIVRHFCKCLMQLMTPEALAIHYHNIPKTYRENYFAHQDHFSLMALIKKHQAFPEDVIPTKLLCFTRSSPLISDMIPDLPETNSNNVAAMKTLIHENPNELLICKLTDTLSQSHLEKALKEFTEDSSLKVFLFVVGMYDDYRETKRVVNHVRIMIEEAESRSHCTKKLFIVLLHFSPVMFFQSCYPSLFLRGWNHYYLDSIVDASVTESLGRNKMYLDIRDWFKRLCLPTASEGVSDTNTLLTALRCLQMEALPILASRVAFWSVDRDSVFFNRQMDCFERIKNLKCLLEEKHLGEVLCARFLKYWTPKVMMQYVRRSAAYMYTQESTLNLTDSIQTSFGSLFFEFLVYMVSLINKDFSIDIIFDPNCPQAVHKYFLEIIKVLPVPPLADLELHSLKPASFSMVRTGYRIQFPLFENIYQTLEDLTEKCREQANQLVESQDSHSEQGKMYMEVTICKLSIQSYTTLLKPSEVKCLEVVASAIKDEQISGKSQIWKRYLKDFIHHKLLLEYSKKEQFRETIHVLILEDYFSPLEWETDILSRMVSLHAHINVHQLHLARLIAALSTLQKLHPGLDVPPSDGILFAHPMKTSEQLSSRYKDFVVFVINNLFSSLQNVLTWEGSECTEGLDSWYKSYLEMTSVPALRENLYSCQIPQQEQSKLTIMQAIFLMMQCTLSEEDCQDMTKETFATLTSLYISSVTAPEVITTKTLLSDIAEIGVNILCGEEHACARKDFIEGLLEHCFPRYHEDYEERDMTWFLDLANSTHSTQPALEHAGEHQDVHFSCLPWNICKFYLARILGVRDQTPYTEPGNPLALYKPKPRSCTSAVLAAAGSPGPYIPQFYQLPEFESIIRLPVPPADDGIMNQPLAHMYFETVMEHLLSKNPSLVYMVEMMEKISQTSENDKEQILLHIEKQALIQVVIKILAQNPDDGVDRLISVHVMDKLNAILQETMEGGHALALALNLLKSTKVSSSKGLIQLLTSEDKRISGISCLNSLRSLLPESIHSEAHTFPFTGAEADCTDLGKLYLEVCKCLQGIDNNRNDEQKVQELVELVEHWCLGRQCDGMDGKLAFKMILWLGVFYKFFDVKKPSKSLSKVIGDVLPDRGFEEEYIQLLRCFLYPKNFMIKIPEYPPSHDLDPEVFIPEMKQDGNEVDPVFQLFSPSGDDTESDVALRRALANMIAAVLGCPPQSNHLWYHVFAADELKNSYMTGFMYPFEVNDVIHYDCGVELSDEGLYGRQSYVIRMLTFPLNLHSLHLVLWANFGAFCIALLTQYNAQDKISGPIITPVLPVRHYCVSQLRKLWLHIRTNAELSLEEEAFFIMKSMQKMLEIGSQRPESHKGRLTSLEELHQYERIWHNDIYVPSMEVLENEFEDYCDELLFRHLRSLELHYPRFPTEADLRNVIEDIPGSSNPNCPLYVLSQFVQQQTYLEAGGAILPDLIEFYQWLHRDLAYTVTFDEATAITIQEKLVEFALKYPDEHLTELYGRVKDGYNKYVEAVGANIGIGACAQMRRENKILVIEDGAKLIPFLSVKDVEGYDWLYVVIEDIIQYHNKLLERLSESVFSRNSTLRSCMPPMSEVHPLQVNEHMCIMGHLKRQHKVSDYLQLVRRRYEPAPKTARTRRFNLEALQKDIVVHYLAGKPKIMEDGTGIHITFKFKQKREHHCNRPTDVVVDTTTLETLPKEFKRLGEPLEPTLRNIELEFHSANYDEILELYTGLKIVADHLIKFLAGKTPPEMLSDCTVSGFLCRFVYTHLQPNPLKGVFEVINIQNISSSGLECLGGIKLAFLYATLKQFVQWINDGLYDFCTIPLGMKKHLRLEDDQALQNIPSKGYYTGSVVAQQKLAQELKQLKESLLHAEAHFQQHLKDMAQKPVIKFLQEIDLVGEADGLPKYIPTTILVENYVYFRAALRRLQDKVNENLKTGMMALLSSGEKWKEPDVSELWVSHLPHLRQSPIRRKELKTRKWTASKESDSESELDEPDEQSKEKVEWESFARKCTVEDVEAFLRSCKLNDCVESFKQYEVDGNILMTAIQSRNDEYLMDIGAKRPRDRLIIRAKFKEYVQKEIIAHIV